MTQNNDVFATPNQGLAAFLQSMGHKATEATLRKSKFEGMSYFFVFGSFDKEVNGETLTVEALTIEKSRDLVSDFYNKKALVEPYMYYEALKELRSLIRDARTTDTTK